VLCYISPLFEDLELHQAKRLEALEEEMTLANAEYILAINRASGYYFACCRVLADVK
jgi:hypothetical protein